MGPHQRGLCAANNEVCLEFIKGYLGLDTSACSLHSELNRVQVGNKNTVRMYEQIFKSFTNTRFTIHKRLRKSLKTATRALALQWVVNRAAEDLHVRWKL